MPSRELSDEAKNLIHQEISEITKEEQSILRELRIKEESILKELSIYLWVARIGTGLLIFIIGGSLTAGIIGVLQFQQYVDSRIAERSQTLIRLILRQTLPLQGNGTSHSQRWIKSSPI